MPALADIERLLERVFERTTARLFRARLQIVQVEHKVERAMERARTQQGAWTVVPSRYRVRLNPGDLTGLAADAGGPEALAGRLADAALGFARAHGYHLSGRPSVAIVADPAVERAEIEVDAVADQRRASAHAQASDEAQASNESPADGQVPVEDPDAHDTPAPHNVPDTPIVAPRSPQVADAQRGAGQPAITTAPGAGPLPFASSGAVAMPAAPVEPVAPAGPDAPAALEAPAAAAPAAPGAPVAGVPVAGMPATASSTSSIRREATETLIFRKPAPPEARAVLRITAPDGKERLLEVGATPLTLGRSADNALMLADARVSRHHGRLQTRRGTLVYTDLGSTNGSRVNGIRVDECALGMGDRIVVGDTVLLVEQLPG
jgi:hypothetical protein